MPADGTGIPRRPGRPRALGREIEGDPTDEILAAASRLIGRLGVDGTPMSRIAREVGLKQSSLYYYFRRKEEIVAALVSRANVVPLELIQRITEGGSAPAQLYRFIRADVLALCELPFDINEVHRIAARDQVEFAAYWKERATLERRLASIVRRGINDGTIRKVDPRLMALTLLSNDEGVQNWHRVGSRWHPGRIATDVAELGVAGLLSDGVSLADVRDEVNELEVASTSSDPSM